MEKTHYIICFDIFDDKRRRKLVKYLEQFTYRIQYSVFCVNADESQIARIKQGIEHEIVDEDSVFIFPMNNTDWKNKIIYGKNYEGIKTCDTKVFVI